MSNEVRWTKTVTEEFIRLGNLSEESEFVLRTRIEKKPISWQAQQLHCSTRTIDRLIQEMKHTYDCVQREHPEIFPLRRTSKEEEYMDNS